MQKDMLYVSTLVMFLITYIKNNYGYDQLQI